MVAEEASANESNLAAEEVETAGNRADAAAERGAGGAEREAVRECMPCHGTGSVVSHLGGERSELPCPWCRGTGVRQADINAQTRWLRGEDASVQGESPGARAGETTPSEV
jgi:hypothetical protein